MGGATHTGLWQVNTASQWSRLARIGTTLPTESFRRRPESILIYLNLSRAWVHLRMDPGLAGMTLWMWKRPK